MSELTRPMRAAGIIAEEMLEFLDIADASGCLSRSTPSTRSLTGIPREGLILLAAQCMLAVAAGDAVHGKDWPATAEEVSDER